MTLDPYMPLPSRAACTRTAQRWSDPLTTPMILMTPPGAAGVHSVRTGHIASLSPNPSLEVKGTFLWGQPPSQVSVLFICFQTKMTTRSYWELWTMPS